MVLCTTKLCVQMCESYNQVDVLHAGGFLEASVQAESSCTYLYVSKNADGNHEEGAWVQEQTNGSEEI